MAEKSIHKLTVNFEKFNGREGRRRKLSLFNMNKKNL